TALSSLCKNCKDTISSPQFQHTPSSIVEAVLKETKKNDKLYKRQALLTLSTILTAFSSSNFFEIVNTTLYGIATGKENQGEENDEQKDKPLTVLIHGASFEALGYAFPSSTFYDVQKKHADEFVEIVTSSLKLAVWNIRVNI